MSISFLQSYKGKDSSLDKLLDRLIEIESDYTRGKDSSLDKLLDRLIEIESDYTSLDIIFKEQEYIQLLIQNLPALLYLTEDFEEIRELFQSTFYIILKSQQD